MINVLKLAKQATPIDTLCSTVDQMSIQLGPAIPLFGELRANLMIEKMVTIRLRLNIDIRMSFCFVGT